MVKKRGEVWYARLTLRDASGKQVQKWISLPQAKNERQAKREEERLKTEVLAGTFVEPSRQTVAQLLDEWFTGKKPGLSARSVERYEERLRVLKSHLGGSLVLRLTASHIRSAYAKMQVSGRLDGRGGLAPQSMFACHSILKAALQQAVDDRLLQWNPAATVKVKFPEPDELRAIDQRETNRLLDFTSNTQNDLPIHLAVLLAACTGMRRNEVLGLRWQDVNLEARILTVNQVIEYVRGREPERRIGFKAPKTRRSRRTLKFPVMVAEALRQHRVKQFEERQLLGEAYQDGGLIVCRADGTPIRPASFSEAFKTLARRAGFPDIHFHSLRHSHISQLIALGEPTKAISERAGHSNYGVTMNRYGHLLPGVEDQMVDRFEASLRAAAEEEKRGKEGSGGGQ